MKCLFYNCSSLTSIPDISKWNPIKVKNIGAMFGYCLSLISLPEISKWNIDKVKDIRFIFTNCSSLVSLPDISKWNMKKIKKKDGPCYNSFLLMEKINNFI